MPQLSNAQLLDRARIESARLKQNLSDLKQQDYELSTLRNRLDIYNLDAFHAQRKELFYEMYRLEYALRRSQGREAILRGKVAAGEIRELAGAA